MRQLAVLLCLSFAVLLFSAGEAWSLPKCPGSYDQNTWTNCVGTRTHANGSKYVGEFRNGKYHGQGTLTTADGNKYVGEFRDGNFNGQGNHTYANGGKYVGEYRDGKPHGKGTYTYASGDKYVGEFRDGNFNGQGTFTHANGDKYIGGQRNGKKHGQGTFTHANGDKYVGAYRDGKPHGKGTYYYLADNQFKGDKHVGEYRDGKYHGQGTYTHADGGKYVGEYRDGKPHGKGTYTYADGGKYVGEFRDGNFNGQGTFTHANGDKYIGGQRNGKKHGQGTYTYADGRVDEGVWENGAFQSTRNDSKIEEGRKLERIAREKREQERIAREKQEAERIARERAAPPVLDILDAPYVALKNANVREQPDVKSPRVTTLSKGSEITALGKVKDKNWYLVSRDGKELGYVFGTLLGELEVEPEISVAAAPEPKAVKAPENKDAVAVIIGNKNYASAHYSVAYAHNDADAISEFVKKQLGYRDGNIIELKDATAGDFMSVFGTDKSHKGKLFDWVRPDQSDVIVYYSGHGVPGLKDGRGYLLPVDGDPDRARLTGYPLELLLDNLAKIPARSITVYLDACFSGGSHRGMLVRSASPILVTPKDVEGTQRMTVLTAASGDQLASWDEDKKHGLFTWHLLEALSGTADGDSYGDGNGEVVLSEVKKYLDAEMTYQARRRYGRDQNVWISGEMERVLVQLGSQQ